MFTGITNQNATYSRFIVASTLRLSTKATVLAPNLFSYFSNLRTLGELGAVQFRDIVYLSFAMLSTSSCGLRRRLEDLWCCTPFTRRSHAVSGEGAEAHCFFRLILYPIVPTTPLACSLTVKPEEPKIVYLKQTALTRELFVLVLYLHPLFSMGGSTSIPQPEKLLHRASAGYEATDGTQEVKEAAARRVLADAALKACRPLLRQFVNLSFVVLPRGTTSSDPSSGRSELPGSHDATSLRRVGQSPLVRVQQSASVRRLPQHPVVWTWQSLPVLHSSSSDPCRA